MSGVQNKIGIETIGGYMKNENVTIYNDDCLERLKKMWPRRIDAMVTDPPAGISFMGKSWDGDKGGRDEWIEYMRQIFWECRRVIKPGGYALVWALPRTSHWTATALENAGFEIRDVVTHLFGSGFPKSLDISKAIDKAAGADRKIIGTKKGVAGENINTLSRCGANDSKSAKGCGAYGKGAKQTSIDIDITEAATEAAKQWDGWGTALKPASEHWILARNGKLDDGTIAKNVLEWGVGGINIDGCRVDVDDKDPNHRRATGENGNCKSMFGVGNNKRPATLQQGRFPSNLVLSGDAPDMLDDQSENVSRFFYCPKPSKSEKGKTNTHPTVKSINLMKYFCRLVTPPGGTIIDPFMGSGSTGLAALDEGFKFIGIERELEYFNIAMDRLGIENET